MSRLFRVVFALAAVAVAAGCVKQQIVEQRRTEEVRLIITRAGNTAALSWRSDPDKIYTVIYADSLTGAPKWQPLPGCEKMRGTGGTMSCSDTVPSADARYYNLEVAPAGK